MKCIHCGKTLKATASFCSGCGNSVAQKSADTKFCNQCGKTLKPTATFCSDCGNTLAPRATHGRKMPQIQTNRKKLIAVASLAVILIGLGIGGYFMWNTFRSAESVTTERYRGRASESEGDASETGRQRVNLLLRDMGSPDEPMTRENFIKLIVATLEMPSETEEIFSDVSESSPINPWITAAVRREIVLPREHGEYFEPEWPITFSLAAIWIVRALGVEAGQGEAIAAIDIGLVADHSEIDFNPEGIATNNQAEELINRMLDILDELTAWNGEEIFHFIYRSDVLVISPQSEFSFIEANNLLIITVYNPDNTVRQLAIGDTFVFEPTYFHPEGLAGHIINVVEQGTSIVITAMLPGSLEEIFYEFELQSEINLLELADQIVLADELVGVDGVEILRNRTSFVGARLNDVTVAGITLTGEVRLYMPRLQISMTTSEVNHLVVSTTAQLSVTASANHSFDRTFTIFTIPIRKFGTGIDVPVGLRVNANGSFHLEFTCGVYAYFGMRNGTPSAQVSFWYEFDFDFHARVAVSIDIQARASVSWIPVYGIRGNFGRGFQINNTMQGRCPARSCFLVETFNVRRITSLNDWGILGWISFLQFDLDLARNRPTTFWHFTNGRWFRFCPHSAGGMVFPINDIAPFFQRCGAHMGHRDSIQMGGYTFHDGIIFGIGPIPSRCFTLHRLDGHFTMLTGYVGQLDGHPASDMNFNVIGDGVVLFTQLLSGSDPPVPISVSVEDVDVLEIEFRTELHISRTFYGAQLFLEVGRVLP